MIQIAPMAKSKIGFSYSSLKNFIWLIFLSVTLVLSRPASSDTWVDIDHLTRKVIAAFEKGDYAQMEQQSREIYKLAVTSFGKGSSEVAFFQGQLALSLFYQGRYTEAVAHYREIVKIQKAILGDRNPDTLNSLNGLAITLNGQGNYQEAEKIHRQILEIMRTTLREKDPLMLRSLNNLADTLDNQGRLDEAEVLHRQRLRILETTAAQSLPGIRINVTQRDIAMTKNNLGKVLYEKGRIAEAEGLFRDALKLLKEIYQQPDHPEIGKTLSNLSGVLREQGRLEEASRDASEALNIKNKKMGENHPSTILTKIQIALLWYEQAKRYDSGDSQRKDLLNKAEKFCQEGLVAMQESVGKEHLDTTPILNTLGLVLNTQNRLAEAEEKFRRALDIRRKRVEASDIHVARLLDNLANTLRDQQHYDEAEKYYRESIVITQAIGSPVYRLSANANLGALLAQQNRLSEAVAPYDTAVQTLDQLFANTRGLSEEARYTFVSQYAHIYRDFIQLLLKLYQQSPQAGYDRKALEVASRQQSRVFTELLRTAKMKDWASDARFNEWKTHRESLRIQLAMLGEKRATVPVTAPDASAIRANLSREIAEREQQLKEVEDWLWRDYPRYMELDAPKPVKVEALQKILQPGEAVWTVVMLPEQVALFVATPERFTLTPVKVAQKTLEDQIKAVRDTLQGVPKAWEKGMREGDERQAVREMILQLKKVPPETLHQLYQHLLAPVEPLLAGTHTVFIVADGALYNLPLELLIRRYETSDAGVFNRLVEDQRATLDTVGKYYATLDYVDNAAYRLHYLPSLAALVAQRQHPKPPVAPARDLIAFADPVFTVPASATSSAPADSAPKSGAPRAILEHYTRSGAWRSSTLSPLPGTAEEVNTIVRELKFPKDRARVYLGDKAQERTVKQLSAQGQLQGLHYLYFSTHGLLGGELLAYQKDHLMPTLRAEPALALTLTGEPPPDNDGFLTMSDVLGLNLNTDWAILSACNTSGETASRGEGFVGLTRAFLYAGTRHLLVSHWYVESGATRDLMIHTFAQAGNTGDLADGLRQARRTLRAESATAHPYFWAPFVVVGD